MDNKKLIRKLINFDEEDTSTGFVATGNQIPNKGKFFNILNRHKNIEISEFPDYNRVDITIVSDVDAPYPDPDMEPDEKLTWIVSIPSVDLEDDEKTYEKAYEDFLWATEDFDPDEHTWHCAFDLDIPENSPEYKNMRKHWDRIKEIMEEIVSSYGQ